MAGTGTPESTRNALPGEFIPVQADQFSRGIGDRGVGFPITKGREGFWPRRNAQALRQSSIIMILGTAPGERVMEPEFGSNLHLLVWEPADEFLEQAIIDEVRSSLERWDPHIELIGVAPEFEEGGTRIKIFIDFFDRNDDDQDPRRLVYHLRRA